MQCSRVFQRLHVLVEPVEDGGSYGFSTALENQAIGLKLGTY